MGAPAAAGRGRADRRACAHCRPVRRPVPVALVVRGEGGRLLQTVVYPGAHGLHREAARIDLPGLPLLVADDRAGCPAVMAAVCGGLLDGYELGGASPYTACIGTPCSGPS